MDKLLINISKSYSYLELSTEEVIRVIDKVKSIVKKGNITDTKKITEIANYEFLLCAKNKLSNGDFIFVINYLNQHNAIGHEIFSVLNGLFKRLGLEISFELGMYLVRNYEPLIDFFRKIVSCIQNSTNPDLTLLLSGDNVESLFGLYCDSNSIDIGDTEEEMITVSSSRDNGSYSGVEDPVKIYLMDIGRYPLLTVEEERELFRKYKEENSKYAKEKLVNCNLRLVVSIAKRYISRVYNRIDFLDLIQEGNIGLMKAIELFDISKESRLSTYATWWIRQSITRYIANTIGLIRIPVHLSDRITKVKKVIEEYELVHQETPSNSIISQITGLSESVVEDCLKAASLDAGLTSLDDTIGENSESTLGEFIPDDCSVEDDVISMVQKSEIADVLATLKPRERQIIEARFGLTNGIPKTLDEIGQSYGLTRERIRQIEEKALRKLRHPSRAKLLKSYTDDSFEVPTLEKKRDDVSYILRNCSEEIKNYILFGLTEREREVLYKKFGRTFLYNNYIGDDSDLFEKVIVPKIKHLYLRAKYKSTTYLGMFNSRDVRYAIENYYILSEEEQELLKKAYGEDLSSSINSNISYKEEETIVKKIVPKMLAFKISDYPRKYMAYQLLFKKDQPFLPSFYIKIMNLLYPDQSITSLLDNIRFDRQVIDGIEYILSLILSDSEVMSLKSRLEYVSLEKLRLSFSDLEDNCDADFQKIINKLRNSPHMIKISNYLFQQSKNIKKRDDYFNFYSFFSADEIKMLPLIMGELGFQDLFNIYKVFKNNLSTSVNRDDISSDDYNDLIDTIKNIRKAFKNNIVDEPAGKVFGDLFEVYRYCDYLYVKPEFAKLLEILTEDEKKALLDCLSQFSDLDISLQYVANKMTKTKEEIISIIKTALEKILKYLRTSKNVREFNQKEVKLILELTKKIR